MLLSKLSCNLNGWQSPLHITPAQKNSATTGQQLSFTPIQQLAKNTTSLNIAGLRLPLTPLSKGEHSSVAPEAPSVAPKAPSITPKNILFFVYGVEKKTIKIKCGEEDQKDIKCYKNVFIRIFCRIFGIATNITINNRNYCLNKKELGDYVFEIAKKHLTSRTLTEDVCIRNNENYLIYVKGTTIKIDLEKKKSDFIAQFFKYLKTISFEDQMSNILNQNIKFSSDFIRKTAVVA